MTNSVRETQMDKDPRKGISDRRPESNKRQPKHNRRQASTLRIHPSIYPVNSFSSVVFLTADKLTNFSSKSYLATDAGITG